MRQDVRAIDWHSDVHRQRGPQDPRRRGPPRACSTRSRARSSISSARTTSGRCAAAPGEIIAQRNGAICRATVDGAVWITHLKRRDTPTETFFKLPATRALALAGPGFDAPEIPVPLDAPLPAGHTFREIAYEEHAGVGYLHFDFYNGAMSTEQCRRLHEAYLFARSRRQTKVIVLMGGSDFFSNGIHLNVIEAADDPAAESWSNLRAIDDVVREIIETDSHLVVSALGGDAAAGGVPFALAADHVVAREDVVLNPYYRHMGGLYGSEYWTYLLPRRVGAELTARLTGPPFTALGTRRAVRDRAARRRLRGRRWTASTPRSALVAERLARDPDLDRRLDGQAAPARARRGDQAAERLSQGGAGPVLPLLLRRGPQLPRGAPALRPQARRTVRRRAGRGRAGAGRIDRYATRSSTTCSLTAGVASGSHGRRWAKRTRVAPGRRARMVKSSSALVPMRLLAGSARPTAVTSTTALSPSTDAVQW